MIEQFLKCIISNTSFFIIFIYICFQSITTISTYNVSEETEFDIEPIERIDAAPYIYPILAILNLSGISDSKVDSNLMKLENSTTEWKNRTEILSERIDELINKSMDESKKYEDKNINLTKEIEKSLKKISLKSEDLNDDQQNNGSFLMKLLFNFYITPILTFYKPLLTEEVKFYKTLINISKQLSNKTEISSKIRQEKINNEHDEANEDFKEVMSQLEYSEQITVKNNNSESEGSEILFNPEASLRIDAENDSTLQIFPKLKQILKISLKNNSDLPNLSELEKNSTNSSEYNLKNEKLMKSEDRKTALKNDTLSQTLVKSTEMPKLSFTNNSEIFNLYKPGEILTLKKKNQLDEKSEAFKIKLPVAINNNDNNSEEKNFTQDHQSQAYVFNTTLETPDDADSLAEEANNLTMQKSDFEISTILPNVSTNLNESDVIEPKILYSPEGSMIPGVVKPTETKSFRLPSQGHHKSRMRPAYSSRYSNNSTLNGSTTLSPRIEDEVKNISTTEKSLIHRLFNNESIYNDQQFVNKTKTFFFGNKLPKNVISTTIASTNEEVTEHFLDKANDEEMTNLKTVRKRELPSSDQYNLNDRQELASYFYNGNKIHESYFNYAKSIGQDIPQDVLQYQDEFNRKSDLNSFGNEANYQKNQNKGFETTQYLNSQNFKSDFNIQQNIPGNFDYLNPSLNSGNKNQKDTSTEISMRSEIKSEKETSTSLLNKNKNILKKRKNKKSEKRNSKKIINRKNINSKRKNNRVSKLKRKNSKTNQGKVFGKSQIGRKKAAKTYSEYKNLKIHNNTQERNKNNKLMKNRKKVSKKVRNKKKNSHRHNINNDSNIDDNENKFSN